VIVGAGALARADGASVLAYARSLVTVTDEWVGFGVLHTAASRVAGLDLSFLPGPEGQDVAGMLAGVKTRSIETVFLLGADEINFESLKGAFVIYQGAVGDGGAGAADVVLPGAAFTEKDGTYINTEGRAQRASRAVFPPGDAREDWTILRALSEVLGSKLPFDDLTSLRAQMIEKVPVLGAIDEQMPGAWGDFGEKGPVGDEPMHSAVANFYMTCPISRASPTMARCVQEFMNSSNQEKAHA
jgi:NADH-quinone oxidoreductase subunit G